MSNTPNPEHIRILAEEFNITPETKYHEYGYLYNSMLSAMQRAVEEDRKTRPTLDDNLRATLLVNFIRASDEVQKGIISDIKERFPQYFPTPEQVAEAVEKCISEIYHERESLQWPPDTHTKVHTAIEGAMKGGRG